MCNYFIHPCSFFFFLNYCVAEEISNQLNDDGKSGSCDDCFELNRVTLDIMRNTNGLE